MKQFKSDGYHTLKQEVYLLLRGTHADRFFDFICKSGWKQKSDGTLEPDVNDWAKRLYALQLRRQMHFYIYISA
jgi:hypothetical protein